MRGLWEFIVYGVVPGTSFQITFRDWVLLMLLLSLHITLRIAQRTTLSRDLRIAVLSVYAVFVIRTQASRLRLTA